MRGSAEADAKWKAQPGGGSSSSRAIPTKMLEMRVKTPGGSMIVTPKQIANEVERVAYLHHLRSLDFMDDV